MGTPLPGCEPLSPVMLWLALGPFHAMENQVLVIRIKIPNSGAVDWTVHSGPQLLFRDVLVSANLSVPSWRGRVQGFVG